MERSGTRLEEQVFPLQMTNQNHVTQTNHTQSFCGKSKQHATLQKNPDQSKFREQNPEHVLASSVIWRHFLPDDHNQEQIPDLQVGAAPQTNKITEL